MKIGETNTRRHYTPTLRNREKAMTGCKIGKVRAKLKVVPTFPVVNPFLIEALINITKAAQEGDVQSGAFVLVARDGSVKSAFYRHTGQTVALVGGCENLKYRIVKELNND